jgi:hypothetical protein
MVQLSLALLATAGRYPLPAITMTFHASSEFDAHSHISCSLALSALRGIDTGCFGIRC